jgi:hypothetical protein
MRRLAAALTACAIVQGSAAGAQAVRYSQQRNLFAVMDVPSTAVRSQPDTYVVKRGGAAVTISLDASTPHYDERQVDCRGGKLGYKLDKPNLFAYSCTVGGEIVYAVTKYGRTYHVGASDATEQIGYTIRYPASQRSYWDPVVKHMTHSLRFVH